MPDRSDEHSERSGVRQRAVRSPFAAPTATLRQYVETRIVAQCSRIFAQLRSRFSARPSSAITSSSATRSSESQSTPAEPTTPPSLAVSAPPSGRWGAAPHGDSGSGVLGGAPPPKQGGYGQIGGDDDGIEMR